MGHAATYPSSLTLKWLGNERARAKRRVVAVSAKVDGKAEDSMPLLVKAARGLPTHRPPAWMMRQAGRYMKSYQKLARKHPSFRERSEETELIVEISLQPYEAFSPDAVILFSDILTPLPALGVDFEIEPKLGPIIADPISTEEQVDKLHALELSQLDFVQDSLQALRKETAQTDTAVLGFVGAPWTLATYIIEGRSTSTYANIKKMAFDGSPVLHKLLQHLTNCIAEYCRYQIDAGAHAIQIFDSWGGCLTPDMWEIFSKPYLQQIVSQVRETHPHAPLTLFTYGSGGLMPRLASTGVDCVGVDWTTDLAVARQLLGPDIAVQGNVDPAALLTSPEVVRREVESVVSKAGTRGHILNLGQGVMQTTPEENVAAFFDAARASTYSDVLTSEVAQAEKSASVVV